MEICGALVLSSSFTLYMIGVHLAILLNVIFALVFGIQGYRSYTSDDLNKQERFPLFLAMALGTLLALICAQKFKPVSKKKAK